MARYYLYFLLLLYSYSSVLAFESTLSIGNTPLYQQSGGPDSHFQYVNTEAPRDGSVTLAAIGYYDSYFPYGFKSQGPHGATLLLYDTLMLASLDETMVAYGLIAKGVSIDPSNLSVAFLLNENAKFSDGSKITATDVKASFELLTSDGAHPRYTSYFRDIRAVEIKDNSQVIFHFTQPNPELPFILATGLPILSKKWLENETIEALSIKKPLASGAYTITQAAFGKSITYERNDAYWAKNIFSRKGMFNFKKVNFSYFKDPQIALQALQSGDIDWIRENNSKKWATQYKRGKFASGELIKKEFTYKNNTGIQGFVFNTRKSHLQDVRVRKAIALAFDFEWANQHLFYGQYRRCLSYFSNSIYGAPTGILDVGQSAVTNAMYARWGEESLQGSNYYRLLLSKPIEERLQEAYSLLQEAGIQTLDIHMPLVQRGFERILHRFSYHLSLIGVHLRYRVYDYALYQQKMDSYQYDMAVTSFPSGERPGNELFNYFHSKVVDIPGQYNFAGSADPLLDKLLTSVIAASTQKQLVDATQKLDRALMSQWLVVPNWFLNYHRIAYSKSLSPPKILPKYYDSIEWMLITWWRS